MNARIENQNELEIVIKDAIKYKSKRLDLNLSYENKYIIPETIGDILSLEELTIFNESLKFINIQEIPLSIDQLFNLKILKIYDCQLDYLPDSIGNLKKLEELQIVDLRQIKEIPNSIGRLKNLKRLKLNGVVSSLANLKKLPESIGQLTSLQHLTIRNTAINSLPDALGDLSNLEYLEIAGNINLNYLPHSIGKLHQLTELNLEGGYLKYLPESISQLQNLKSLEIKSNLLECLPESIGNLAKLEYLGLIDNQLIELPESIGELCGLKYDIDAYINPLKTLPVSASKLLVKILH